MKSKIFAAVLGLVFAAGIWVYGSEAAVSDLSENIVRLHILANSDSEEDQNLKLAVRDRLLAYVRECEELEQLDKSEIQKHLTEFVTVCREEIKANGFEYEVRAVVGNFYFPTKQYEHIMLPAGNYDALRIIIGEGKGQNWWCVMYPPLCFTSETKGTLSQEEMERLKEGMEEQTFEMIQTGDSEVVIKPAFKLVEWWQEAKHALFP